jgi:hypothetical protein
MSKAAAINERLGSKAPLPKPRIAYAPIGIVTTHRIESRFYERALLLHSSV